MSFADSDKLKYWNYDKNNNKNPTTMSKWDKKLYWFDCDCGHTFKISPDSIITNSWCPYCANPPKKLCDDIECKKCLEKSFASNEKAKYWSEENKLKPRDIFKSSGKKFWFNCNCGHKFEIKLSKISNGVWCSYCANPPSKLCSEAECKKCFDKSFASSEKSKYWNYDKNKTKPRDIFKCSGKKYWFDCECGHSFECSIDSIVKGSWCSYCSKKKLCEFENCEKCLNNSFASHEKAKCWSDINKLKPRFVFKFSNTKHWFSCVCGHDFDCKIADVSTGGWCPYCASPPKKICDNLDCKKCFEKSFASDERSKYWNYDKNKTKPRDIFKCSGKKYWFNCECGHDFIVNLSAFIHNTWCPYCSNPPNRLCDKEDCEKCFNNSFASHEKAKYWSSENIIKTREVLKGSEKKAIFICDKGHNFHKAIYAVTSPKQATWCPICVNKGEAKLFEVLSIHYALSMQRKFDWCVSIETNERLPFDFIIDNSTIIVELDGGQHFKQVSNWDPPKKIQKGDVYKMKCANKNGYSIIRILWDDVYYDKNNWLEKLISAIEKIKTDEIIQNIFICNNGEYAAHIDLYNDNYAENYQEVLKV